MLPTGGRRDGRDEVLRRTSGGWRIAPGFLDRLEECLATKLSDLAIRPADLASGGPALSLGGTILLDRGFARQADAAALRLVLAHEAVHEAQRRTPVDAGFDPELDAALGAAAILAGRRYRPRARLRRGAIAAWGEDGHYYTCYVVGLMAGVDPEAARLRALFCQMPDEVHEFDATSAFWDMRRDVPVDVEDMRYDRSAITTRVYAAPRTAIIVRTERPDRTQARKTHDLAIQAGLHCLTGESAIVERARRTTLFDGIARGDHLTYGLALHAYGDSFAHMHVTGTRPTMYGPGRGHAHDGHAPDFIGGHVTAYGHYVGGLYDRFRSGLSTTAPLTRDQAVQALTDYARRAGKPGHWEEYVSDGATTRRNCDMLRALAASLPQRFSLHPFRPETVDATEWRNWWPRHAGSLRAVRPNRTPREIYEEIARIALRWAPPNLRSFDRRRVELDFVW